MYVKRLNVYEFRCFGAAELELQYPGRQAEPISDISNVNLILGDNGGGKTSVLRALAIAVLAPALLESGFVPSRLVRRTDDDTPRKSLLKIEGIATANEKQKTSRKRKLELLARLEMRGGRGNLDRLHLESTPESPISDLIFDDYSPAFFVAGYGATRRVETGEFSESSARRSRGLRYQRVAGLFEDHVALRPLQSWLPRLTSDLGKQDAAITQLRRVLPPQIAFTGEQDEENQYLFQLNGNTSPFSSLSDGYKAFIGFASDLVSHLVDVAPPKTAIDEIPGLVLVDEIDLHLHPEWQRTVVPALAAAFPRIQFVFTSHSALVASTVKKENVFLTDLDNAGVPTVRQSDENVFGRSAEQLLLSSYFGLTTTRAEGFHAQAVELFEEAAKGSSDAAIQYLKRLTEPLERITTDVRKTNN